MPQKTQQSTQPKLRAEGSLARSFSFERSSINEENRTVELAFSSELPYERYWGIEILDHSPQSIRLGRLSGRGPLLVDHDTRDHIGVIESVSIGADRVGRAVVRFGRSTRAEEVFRDVIDGIRHHVSVAYEIFAWLLESAVDGLETYRITDWEPYEISFVSVPADPTVGVGRSAEQQSEFNPKNADVRIDEPSSEAPIVQVIIEEPIMPDPVIDPVNQVDKVAAERARVSTLLAIGEQFKFYGADKRAAAAIGGGATVEQFRAEVMDLVAKMPAPSADIGLTDKEARSFSMLRVLNSLANPTDARAREGAAFEFETARAAAEKQGREVKGILVPFDVLKRQLTVGTPAAGGNLVTTDLLTGDFIEMLRHSMVLSGLGMRTLAGLIGNIAIPRQTGGATAYWVSEAGTGTGSQGTFDQVAMSPKTLMARTQISRKLLIQTALDIENMVRNDLALALGLELQRAAISGSGTAPEPRGILNMSGIGAVVGGTNGLAPTWDHIVDLETAVANANANVGSIGYLTNTKVRGKLKKTFVDSPGSGERVWGKGNSPLNEYAAAVTNSVPSTLTKGSAAGVCSAIIHGNFADLFMGLWGGLELQVDPYGAGDEGAVIVRAFQDADVAARHEASFAAMKDALTA